MTEVALLTTWLDLKEQWRIPVVPFSTITSASARMSIAEVGRVTVKKKKGIQLNQ